MSDQARINQFGSAVDPEAPLVSQISLETPNPASTASGQLAEDEEEKQFTRSLYLYFRRTGKMKFLSSSPLSIGAETQRPTPPASQQLARGKGKKEPGNIYAACQIVPNPSPNAPSQRPASNFYLFF